MIDERTMVVGDGGGTADGDGKEEGGVRMLRRGKAKQLSRRNST